MEIFSCFHKPNPEQIAMYTDEDVLKETEMKSSSSSSISNTYYIILFCVMVIGMTILIYYL